jgi:predicted nuclease of predicted toxin-antitoxin system
MRVFLDEKVDLRLGDQLIGATVESVHSRAWFGLQNGELIRRIADEFDVFLSHDAGLAHQHNWLSIDP